MADLGNNRSVQMLEAAEKGKYGIVACVCYNIEGILAVRDAAEALNSPAMILLFPHALTYAASRANTTSSSNSSPSLSSSLVRFAAHVAHLSHVPIALHLDHCTSPSEVRFAADIGPESGFDSIMVDMSRLEKADNLRMTRELVGYCRERGIATEAEPGRIEGGEDGLVDTAGLEGALTTEEEVEEFVDTGIDFLAPSFGNIHGEYGTRGIRLEFDRLEKIRKKTTGRVRLVLHGTNGFGQEVLTRCIAGGISKFNVNKVVNAACNEVWGNTGDKKGVTEVMETARTAMRKEVEELMRMCGSVGKAGG